MCHFVCVYVMVERGIKLSSSLSPLKWLIIPSALVVAYFWKTALCLWPRAIDLVNTSDALLSALEYYLIVCSGGNKAAVWLMKEVQGAFFPAATASERPYRLRFTLALTQFAYKWESISHYCIGVILIIGLLNRIWYCTGGWCVCWDRRSPEHCFLHQWSDVVTHVSPLQSLYFLSC